jgi:glutamate-1-semialdehyde 2,1-aminomutase
VCIFDEVKTGFRTGLSGYQERCNGRPHLSVFVKAVANGFPLGVIGGKHDIMQLFDAAYSTKRVLIAGTYDAHPRNAAAAIATITFIKEHNVHEQLEERCQHLYRGLGDIFHEKGRSFVLSSNASASCTYSATRNLVTFTIYCSIIIEILIFAIGKN